LNNKRYIVDGLESISVKRREVSDYYAFKLKPNLDIVVTDKQYSNTIKIITNNDGFRFPEIKALRKSIMVLGDSVTFGSGVNNGETYSDCLGNLLVNKYNVMNYGCPQWGFAEYYLTYKKYVKDVKPILIIMGIFPSNDFNDLFSSSWQGKAEGELPVPPLQRNDVYIDKSNYFRSTEITYKISILRDIATFIFISKNILQPIIHLNNKLKDKFNKLSTEELSIKIISDIAKNNNLLLLILPAQYNYDDKKSLEKVKLYVRQLEKIEGVHVLNLYNIIEPRRKELYVDGSHFNKEGNKIVATEIYQYLNKNQLLEIK
jgi:hypothetical protein